VPAPPSPPKAADGTSQRRTEAERAEIDAKLRDAQERLSRAASEVAALAAERAADAVDSFADWSDDWTRRSIIGAQLVSEGKEGAKVVDVSPGGPAELAGVRPGDVITAIDGKDVRGNATRDVVRILRKVEPDTKVKLRVMRDGKPRDIDVVARRFRANAYVHVDPPPGFDNERFRGPPFGNFWPGSELSGLEVTTLTPQLGRYFGTDKGVLVVRAPKSEVFKLQDGDVILSIDGREPASGSHISRILSSYHPGEQFTLRVLRDRKPQEFVVTCPDNRRTRTRTTWLGDPP
jgi:S1-C subfamily serine protease